MDRTEFVKTNTQSDQVTYEALVNRAIVITGATASGKSGVALELAEQIGGEILSLDSIAVYRGMDIGTAKPNTDEQKRVPHHLIDLADPSDDFSVAMYLKAAHLAVQEIEGRGRKPIFVGGTPMYLKAILRGFDPGPPPDWTFREQVESDVQEYGSELLHQRLRQVDPLAAHRINPTDVRRMIRALEVARQTGQPLSHQQVQFDRATAADNCLVFSLQWPRHELHARINARVEAMFDQGLVDEVKALIDTHGKLSRTASQAVGYRELIDFLQGESSLEQTKEFVAAHTRQLARKQETWFRSFREIRCMHVKDDGIANVLEEIALQIQQFSSPG